MPLAPGDRLGPYQILDPIGAGGMGEVWRAQDQRLNRAVAVKILPLDVANDPARRARFEQEARALGALNHPNIVSVFDTGQERGQAYIVSELVAGESLRAVIDHGRLPLRKLASYAVQIADALAAAHAVGIVHRDLKPENIMVTPEGRVKVLDFGLAKQTVSQPGENTATMAISQPGTLLGTAGYMSPEQVRGEPVDHRSDIFSFGAVLYELITGQRAFHAGSSVETMNAILREEPADFEPKLALPQPLATIVHRCLEKRPEQRFQSAADLAFALRAVTSTASGVESITSPAKTPSRRRWLRVALFLLGAIALFIAGFFASTRSRRIPAPTYQRITFRKGLVTNARFTPDGRNVIYSANWDGGPGRVYLATPGNPQERDLDLAGILLDVSSRQEIAFLMGPYTPDGTGTLARGSISGGQMRPWLTGVQNAVWSPDGSTMAVLREIDGKYRLEYPIGKILMDRLGYPIFGMRVSPDGAHIAFGHYHGGSAIGLSIVDRDGKRQSLGDVSGQIPDVVDPFMTWSPDGREIWFRSFDPKEWGTIYAVDLKGRRRTVARLPSSVVVFDMVRDGRLLLRTDMRQVGILGVAPGETAERDLSCLDAANLRGISEDGRMIAATIIGESGGPNGSVYLRKTDGSPPIRLGDGAALALSADGKWVSSYTSSDPRSRRYALLPTGTGEEREISIPKLDGVNAVIGASRDDREFFVQGPSESKHEWQLYAWNSVTGALRAISPPGIPDSAKLVSPDRTQIIALGPDERWWSFSTTGAAAREVHGLADDDIPVGWRDDNRSIFVIAPQQDPRAFSVSVVDIASGKRTPWKEIRTNRPVDGLSNLKITPDGRAYAFNFRIKFSDLYIAAGL